MNHPLAFSDAQLALVQHAAALLAPQLRGRFLTLLAHELRDTTPITDDAVRQAIDAILRAASTKEATS
jgi:hypothetical protein